MCNPPLTSSLSRKSVTLPRITQPPRMDSAAYLRKHGWQGKGHSLHPSKPHSLSRPLLISKKPDVLGLGNHKHSAVTDQWWLKAFDSSLKDFGKGKTSLLDNVRAHGVARGGLYSRFVAGEGFKGTIEMKKVVADDGLGGAGAVGVVDLAGSGASKKRRLSTASQDKDAKAGGSTTAVKKRKVEPDSDKSLRGGDYASTMAKKKKKKEEKKMRKEQKREQKSKRWKGKVESGSSTAAAGVEGEQAEQTGPKISVKAEKYAREKARRELKRTLRENAAATSISTSAMAEMDTAAVSSGYGSTTKPLRPMQNTKTKRNKVVKTGANQIPVTIKRIPSTPALGQDSVNSTAAADGTTSEQSSLSANAPRKLSTKNFTTQDLLERKLASLPLEKRARYSDKAAKKGLSLEQYYLRRLKKDAMEQTNGKPLEEYTPAELKALPAELALLIIDPMAWKTEEDQGRIKDIPRDVRKRRQIWMAAVRAQKRDALVAAVLKKAKKPKRDKRLLKGRGKAK